MFRSSNRGTAIIERVVAGVCIRRASGTTDPDTFAAIGRMLDEFHREGRDDLARAIADDHIKAVVLWQAYRRQGLSLQLVPERALRARATIDAWLKRAEQRGDLMPKTCYDYGRWLTTMIGSRPGASVAELPDLLARYRRRSHAVTFNRTRAALLSFFADTLARGSRSPLYQDAAAIRSRTPGRRTVGLALEPELARTVAEKLGRLGPMWWTLVCTGMGRKEYWETPWRVLKDRVVIEGTKRESRLRIVPHVTTPVRPLCGERAFERALRAVGDALGIRRLTIYVARRTFAHIMELAGIDDSRCDAYMGHRPKGVRGGYREHDVAPHLGPDRAAIRAVVGRDPRYVQVVA